MMMKIITGNIRTAGSLRTMVEEMFRKNLELKRITKTASLLIESGLSANSIPPEVMKTCLEQQHSDGGWAGIVDTIWNAFFLKKMDRAAFVASIARGLDYIQSQKNEHGLWGRSQRDISRIPVSGILFYLFPELAQTGELELLEELWLSEKNSLTYKAAYTLMAFNAAGYRPRRQASLIEETVSWLASNQKDDGGFSPWKDHPVDADVFCTSIAVLGLLQYHRLVERVVFERALSWLAENRLKSGIWKYHEIEDGASWGLFALTQLVRYFEESDG